MHVGMYVRLYVHMYVEGKCVYNLWHVLLNWLFFSKV